MNVAIFTDLDVHPAADTLTLQALRYAPPDVCLRIYTAAPVTIAHPQYIGLPPIGPLPRLSRYVKAVRDSDAEVVHVDVAGPIGLVGMYVAWRFGLPLVASVDGAAPASQARWLYTRCTRVVAPSHHACERLVAEGIARELVKVCASGVDANVFSPARRSQDLRERWHVSARRPAIVSAARTFQSHGLQMLAAFRDRLHARGIEHAMVIAGEGNIGPAWRHRLGDAVFAGRLSQDALAETLASADLGVFPAALDQIGAVVLEAQASGLPVLVGSDGDGRESMADGLTGLVCQCDGPDGWAEIVASLVRAPHVLDMMRGHARRHAVLRGWPQAVAPLFDVYRAALREASPSGSVDPDAHPFTVEEPPSRVKPVA